MYKHTPCSHVEKLENDSCFFLGGPFPVVVGSSPTVAASRCGAAVGRFLKKLSKVRPVCSAGDTSSASFGLVGAFVFILEKMGNSGKADCGDATSPWCDGGRWSRSSMVGMRHLHGGRRSRSHQRGLHHRRNLSHLVRFGTVGESVGTVCNLQSRPTRCRACLVSSSGRILRLGIFYSTSGRFTLWGDGKFLDSLSNRLYRVALRRAL